MQCTTTQDAAQLPSEPWLHGGSSLSYRITAKPSSIVNGEGMEDDDAGHLGQFKRSRLMEPTEESDVFEVEDQD